MTRPRGTTDLGADGLGMSCLRSDSAGTLWSLVESLTGGYDGSSHLTSMA